MKIVGHSIRKIDGLMIATGVAGLGENKQVR